MAPTYRCVVHDQHGPYVCWQGSDIAEALANAEQHVGAHMVSVERFEHAWGGYWKCIQGVWL